MTLVSERYPVQQPPPLNCPQRCTHITGTTLGRFVLYRQMLPLRTRLFLLSGAATAWEQHRSAHRCSSAAPAPVSRRFPAAALSAAPPQLVTDNRGTTEPGWVLTQLGECWPGHPQPLQATRASLHHHFSHRCLHCRSQCHSPATRRVGLVSLQHATTITAPPGDIKKMELPFYKPSHFPSHSP